MNGTPTESQPSPMCGTRPVRKLVFVQKGDFGKISKTAISRFFSGRASQNVARHLLQLQPVLEFGQFEVTDGCSSEWASTYAEHIFYEPCVQTFTLHQRQ